jgi:prevent-host-death family protein
MDISVADAQNTLPELLRLVEAGEQVVITRNGKPVAQIVAPPLQRRVVTFGTMRGKIHCKSGWDDHIDLVRTTQSVYEWKVSEVDVDNSAWEDQRVETAEAALLAVETALGNQE